MPVSAVSFDADGTLWDFDAVMRRALAVVLDSLRTRAGGAAAADLTVDTMIGIRERVAREASHDWSRLEEIRRAAFEATLAHIGIEEPGLADELNELYLRHRFDDIELFEDVLPCLDALAEHRPIGLLSNGNSHPERCGLDGRFAFTVFAQEHGVAKPDPAVFRLAAERAGCDVSALVHVGDGEADVLGARAAGCYAVLIDRSVTRPGHARHADARLTDLRELPAVLVALDATEPGRG